MCNIYDDPESLNEGGFKIYDEPESIATLRDVFKIYGEPKAPKEAKCAEKCE